MEGISNIHYNIVGNPEYEMKMTYGMTAKFTCKADLVFDGIKIDQCSEILVGCLIIAVISLLFEYLLSLKQTLYLKFERKLRDDSFDINEELKLKVTLTILQFLVMFFSAILMFAIMSYNLYFSLVVVTFNAIGLFAFMPIEGRKVECHGCCQIS
jgi:hypothetical protein